MCVCVCECVSEFVCVAGRMAGQGGVGLLLWVALARCPAPALQHGACVVVVVAAVALPMCVPCLYLLVLFAPVPACAAPPPPSHPRSALYSKYGMRLRA